MKWLPAVCYNEDVSLEMEAHKRWLQNYTDGFCWVISKDDLIFGFKWIDDKGVVNTRPFNGELHWGLLSNIIDDFFKNDSKNICNFFINATDEQLLLLKTMYKLKDI